MHLNIAYLSTIVEQLLTHLDVIFQIPNTTTPS